MTVSYRTAINIVQIIFFAPVAPLAIWLCVKDGIKQANTWRFIATLSLLRTAGSIAYFVSLSHPTVSGETAVIVCELVGLAPLMLILVAFIARANKTTKTYPGKVSLIITASALCGLICGIVGTDHALEHATTASDVGSNKLIEAALGLFIGCYGVMFLGLCLVIGDITMHRQKRIALGKEIGLIYTVCLAAPFVLVRFIYAALGDYSGNPKFSVLTGDNTTYLCMDVLMEIFAVIICVASAFFVPPPPKVMKKKEDDGELSTEGEDGHAQEQQLSELGPEPENRTKESTRLEEGQKE